MNKCDWRRNVGKICIGTIISMFVFFPPFSAWAEEIGETAAGWGGDAELGYLMTTGNTETLSLTARLGIRNETQRWENGLVFESVYNSEESEETDERTTTVQRFLTTLKSNYKLDSRNRVFGQVLFEDDRFSGFEYQVTASTGYHRVIAKRERLEWSAEIGPGYRYSKIDDDIAEDESESEAIIHLGTRFLYQLSETATFEQEVTIGAGPDNTITRSTTALRAAIIGSLAMKLSFNLKYTSDVPDDTKSTETETALTLLYGF